MISRFFDWLFYDTMWGMLLLVAIVIGLCVLMGIAAVEEQKQWDAFAVEHHCVKVGEKKSQVTTTTMPVISANGQVGMGFGTSVTPKQTAWQCDDGVMYWR